MYLPGAEMHLDPLLEYPSFPAPGILPIRASGAENKDIHIVGVHRSRNIMIKVFQLLLPRPNSVLYLQDVQVNRQYC